MRRRGIRSQSQLARLSGISQPSVHRILTDPYGYTPGRRVVARLAAALAVPESWLADGQLPEGRTPDEAPLFATPPPHPAARHPASGYQRLAALYSRLTPPQRAVVLALAQALLDSAGPAPLIRPGAEPGARPP